MIVFDVMIWWYDDDMIMMIWYNKEFQTVVKELFIRCRKLNISLVFITQYYFSVPQDVRLNSTHYLIMKINNKRRELQNILQILVIKILWKFTGNVQKIRILFWLLIQSYQLKILQIQKKSFLWIIKMTVAD